MENKTIYNPRVPQADKQDVHQSTILATLFIRNGSYMKTQSKSKESLLLEKVVKECREKLQKEKKKMEKLITQYTTAKSNRKKMTSSYYN